MKTLVAVGAMALLCGCHGPPARSGDGNSAGSAGGGAAAVQPVPNNRAVVVGLSTSSPSPGPVNVHAYLGERLMGSWVVRVGEPPVVIGVPGAGFVTLQWTWPDGRPARRKVKVRNDPVRVWLDKD